MHELHNSISFCELRAKEVVNVLDGRRLGRIVDVIFSDCDKAHVKGIVVPYARRFFFFKEKDVFVPWHCIRRIGEDVILVELILDGGHGHDHHHRRRRRRYAEFDGHGGGGGHGGGNAHVHSIGSDGDIRDDADDEEDEPKVRYNKPQFDLQKKAAPKKKSVKSSESSARSCDGKCEKCMLFDCEHRWKENSDK